eukprot:1943671-Pyramimonas_sp.AAC.1
MSSVGSSPSRRLSGVDGGACSRKSRAGRVTCGPGTTPRREAHGPLVADCGRRSDTGPGGGCVG